MNKQRKNYIKISHSLIQFSPRLRIKVADSNSHSKLWLHYKQRIETLERKKSTNFLYFVQNIPTILNVSRQTYRCFLNPKHQHCLTCEHKTCWQNLKFENRRSLPYRRIELHSFSFLNQYINCSYRFSMISQIERYRHFVNLKSLKLFSNYRWFACIQISKGCLWI